MQIENKTIVVTGAGSGIGRALSIQLLAKNANVVGVDINLNALLETQKIANVSDERFKPFVVDITNKETVEALPAQVIKHFGAVDGIINNAGIIQHFIPIKDLSYDEINRVFNVNFFGTVYMTKAFLPYFIDRPEAHIVNISSVFGLVAPPEQTAYCASKFAVRGFTESLRHELEDTNVRVSCVHPGGIKTNIARNSRLGEKTPEDYKDQGVKFFDKVALTSPETAADVIVKGIKSKNPRILIGKDAYAINYVSRLFPRKYLRVIEKLSGHRLDLREKS